MYPEVQYEEKNYETSNGCMKAHAAGEIGSGLSPRTLWVHFGHLQIPALWLGH